MTENSLAGKYLCLMVGKSGGFSMTRVTVTILESADPPILVLTRVAVPIDSAYNTKHSIEFSTTVLKVWTCVWVYFSPFLSPTLHHTTHTTQCHAHISNNIPQQMNSKGSSYLHEMCAYSLVNDSQCWTLTEKWIACFVAQTWLCSWASVSFNPSRLMVCSEKASSDMVTLSPNVQFQIPKIKSVSSLHVHVTLAFGLNPR